MICAEKKLVDGKAVCETKKALDRVTYCKQEGVKNGKVACLAKQSAWPNYVCEGKFKDAKGAEHCSRTIIQMVNVSCQEYKFQKGKRFCAKNVHYFGDQFSLHVCKKAQRIANTKLKSQAQQCLTSEVKTEVDLVKLMKSFEAK